MTIAIADDWGGVSQTLAFMEVPRPELIKAIMPETVECEGCKRRDALLAEKNQAIEQLSKELREEVHKVNTLLKGEPYPG